MTNQDERYKRWESWKPRRWAWEFLKRNPEFRAACDSVVRRDDQARQTVADRFGLKSFKHYGEKFSRSRSEPDVRAPKFVTGAISVRSNVGNLKTERKIRITLRPGQVAIVFDIQNGAVNAKGIELQIKRATKSLFDRTLKYESSLQFRTTDQRLDSNRKTFLKYLNLLDALACIQNKRGAIQSLNHSDDEEDAVRNKYKNALNKAIYNRDAGYLDIAVMSE